MDQGPYEPTKQPGFKAKKSSAKYLLRACMRTNTVGLPADSTLVTPGFCKAVHSPDPASLLSNQTSNAVT